MTNYVIKVDTLNIKISHIGFLKYSKNFLNLESCIKESTKYNPVPYFLLCKSIELSLKSYLLCLDHEIKDLKKKSLGHNLSKLFEKAEKQKNSIVSLNNLQKDNLRRSTVYYGNITKSFEYFNVGHAASKFEKLPNPLNVKMPELDILMEIAIKLIKIIEKHYKSKKEIK